MPLAIVAVLLVLLAARPRDPGDRAPAPGPARVVERRRAAPAGAGGRKAGRARAPAETPREYARALAERLGDERLAAVGDTLDADLYSPQGRPPESEAGRDAVLTSL